MTITPDLAEVIANAIESALIDVHVALPGKVESYDSATQTANVQLQVKRMLPKTDGQYATEDLPVLENIPVQFPRTRTFAFTMPVAEGDFGLVVFSEMSIDQWRSKGDNTSPGDIGRHTLTGAVFQPGLMPNAEAIGDDIGDDAVFGEIGGVQVRVKPGGVCEVVTGGGPTADDFVAQAAKTKKALDDILAIFSTGTPVGLDGGAALQTAWISAAALVVTDVASSNLKADD
jgi:hypothetical protein